jgi:hypothetical protein
MDEPPYPFLVAFRKRRAKSLLDTLIIFFGGGPYCHVEAWLIEEPMGFRAEAGHTSGWYTRPAAGNLAEWDLFQVNATSKDVLMDACNRRRGRIYDYLGLCRFVPGLRHIAAGIRFILDSIQLMGAAPDLALFCSDCTAGILDEACGEALQDLDRISPSALGWDMVLNAQTIYSSEGIKVIVQRQSPSGVDESRDDNNPSHSSAGAADGQQFDNQRQSIAPLGTRR